MDDLDTTASIVIGRFEDFSVELKLAKVDYRYGAARAMLVATSPDFGKEPDANVFASMRLERDKSVSARIWASGDIYYIAPVEDGPLHVLRQVDPDKKPKLD